MWSEFSFSWNSSIVTIRSFSGGERNAPPLATGASLLPPAPPVWMNRGASSNPGSAVQLPSILYALYALSSSLRTLPESHFGGLPLAKPQTGTQPRRPQERHPVVGELLLTLLGPGPGAMRFNSTHSDSEGDSVALGKLQRGKRRAHERALTSDNFVALWQVSHGSVVVGFLASRRTPRDPISSSTSRAARSMFFVLVSIRASFVLSCIPGVPVDVGILAAAQNTEQHLQLPPENTDWNTGRGGERTVFLGSTLHVGSSWPWGKRNSGIQGPKGVSGIRIIESNTRRR
ncbi:hypothetical protein CPAR01_13764 [Colletotrichum paranaense]|uniref:Uncharacterized protein n=1 Tax=Colletotrichum paranaense TaxID=1914294 RepID=A0ABQ9S4B5_9PEZI|nr:uncharacterized protein CPAR01_13764 [Colletotrichum paranaense]KAK1524816.1 hypothetical protein CPAR01_13764 [Colletotrichum paranaense]